VNLNEDRPTLSAENKIQARSMTLLLWRYKVCAVIRHNFSARKRESKNNEVGLQAHH